MAQSVPSRRMQKANRAASQKQYDRMRGTSTQRGLGSDWTPIAEMVRERDGQMCQRCMESDCIIDAVESQCRSEDALPVDHIIPRHVRPDWRLEMQNCETLCQRHHKRKTDIDNKTYGSETAKHLTPAQVRNRELAQRMKLEDIRK